jgi:pyruvate formate-lyase activating enzyme-like uncharacterized protein
MAKIAEMRGDPMSKFHNALYTGNVETRVNVLAEVGMSESRVHVSRGESRTHNLPDAQLLSLT